MMMNNTKEYHNDGGDGGDDDDDDHFDDIKYDIDDVDDVDDIDKHETCFDVITTKYYDSIKVLLS